MRVSIWQQFSSNNSSSYVVVGRFQTEQEAQVARDAARDVVKRIWDWYAAHPEAREEAQYVDAPPTEAEQLIAQQYEIEIPEAFDWIARELSPAFIRDSVVAYENYVYLAVLDETLTTDTPFVQLMRRLGGEVKHEQEFYIERTVNIIGTAPDSLTAEYITQVAETYLTRNRDSSYVLTGRAPWAVFCDGQLASDLEELNAQINLYLAHEQTWREWQKGTQGLRDDLGKRLDEARRLGDEVTANAITQQLKALYKTPDQIGSGLSPDIYAHVGKLLDQTNAEELFDPIEAQTNGYQISLRNLWFFDRSLGHGLPALVTWLRALGCIDVSYEFVSVPRHRNSPSEQP